MTQNTDMQETMEEIYGVHTTITDRRSVLEKGIQSLETQIKSALNAISKSSSARTTYHSTTSPEEANQRHREVVFLKKDLEKMKSEIDQLSV